MNNAENPRVIVALDFPTHETAFQLVERLDPQFCRLKVGMTMFTHYGPAFIEELMQDGFSVFLDLKFHDIPHQVAGACRSAAALGVWMLTIHTFGGPAMCEAAANAVAQYTNRPHLLGVTVLTSAHQEDLNAIGIEKSLNTTVRDLAKMAENTGLDGVVCSAHEVADLRHHLRSNFLFVTPGIRLATDANDDQKRVMTPEEAFQVGADYLVMGRSIAQAKDPMALLKTIQ